MTWNLLMIKKEHYGLVKFAIQKRFIPMCRYNKKGDGRRIDPCMRVVISNLNEHGIKTLACCCGHGKYPMTIVIDAGVKIGRVVPLEIFSGIVLPRKKRFYVKDDAGHYVIPKTIGGEL